MPSVDIVTRLSRPASYMQRVLAGLCRQAGADLHWSLVTQMELTPAHRTCIEQAEAHGISVSISRAKKGVPLGQLANIGVKAGGFDFVLLHDDDDALMCDFLGLALGRFSDSRCAAVTCHTAFINESDDAEALNYVMSPGKGVVSPVDLASDNVMATNGLLYRRTAYDEIGGYPEDVGVAEDWLFSLKLMKVGTIAILPRVCAAVYIRDRRDKNCVEANTDKQEHVEMRNAIRRAEAAGDMQRLTEKLNTRRQKLMRAVDRAVYRLTGKFLPR